MKKYITIILYYPFFNLALIKKVTYVVYEQMAQL